MSDPSSSGTENTGPAKKPVSAVRNVIGLVALIAVLTVGGFEYSAKMGYSSAVNALDARMDNENADMMSPAEAERLIGKPSDDAGSKVEENRQTFTKQTYTWRGPLKSYTLTAYYTQGMGAGMHHFETPDQKYNPDRVAAPAVVGAPGRGRARKPRCSQRPESRKTRTFRQPRSPRTQRRLRRRPRSRKTRRTRQTRRRPRRPRPRRTQRTPRTRRPPSENSSRGLRSWNHA